MTLEPRERHPQLGAILQGDEEDGERDVVGVPAGPAGDDFIEADMGRCRSVLVDEIEAPATKVSELVDHSRVACRHQPHLGGRRAEPCPSRDRDAIRSQRDVVDRDPAIGRRERFIRERSSRPGDVLDRRWRRRIADEVRGEIFDGRHVPGAGRGNRLANGRQGLENRLEQGLVYHLRPDSRGLANDAQSAPQRTKSRSSGRSDRHGVFPLVRVVLLARPLLHARASPSFPSHGREGPSMSEDES